MQFLRFSVSAGRAEAQLGEVGTLLNFSLLIFSLTLLTKFIKIHSYVHVEVIACQTCEMFLNTLYFTYR